MSEEKQIELREDQVSSEESSSEEKVDIATAIKDVDIEATETELKGSPPMTFKRFMALLSLVWLLVTSATPLVFLTATLSICT
jgi:hypothetical protein